MDEDTKLFEHQPTLFDFHEGDEAEGADEATAELLEEIDRSLHGFRQAAHTNAWLGDAGLNAEERLVEEATEARSLGDRAGTVDLAKFVCDAVRLDGGQVTGAIEDDHFQLRLPPAWCHGLEDLPGYDPAKRVVHLTTKLDVITDSDKNPVGYLGRAHPLVRRALDRVRNLSFGGMAKSGQDPRASAARGDVPEPTLLYTFLGRISSRAGRELERALAVKVTSSGDTEVFDTADQWAPLADPDKAIRTTDLWDNHFKEWGDGARHRAEKTALAGFRPIAKTYVQQRTKSLAAEQQSQQEWLRKRAEEITGKARSVDVQPELFDKHGEASGGGPPLSAWLSITDPAERLAAFASDSHQPPSKRSEADGVLRIYRQRTGVLDSLAALGEPEIVPLGVLMLVPGE